MKHSIRHLKTHIRTAQLIAAGQVNHFKHFGEGICHAVAVLAPGPRKVENIETRKTFLTLSRVVRDLGVNQKYNKSRLPKPLLYCV